MGRRNFSAERMKIETCFIRVSRNLIIKPNTPAKMVSLRKSQTKKNLNQIM